MMYLQTTPKAAQPHRHATYVAAAFFALGLGVFTAFTALAPTPAAAVDASTPDWPCVQRKVETLTAAQMWDGPSIEGLENEWWKDDDVRKLVPRLISRRKPIEDVEKSIEEFAKSTPEDKRDARMTLLFAGALDETNKIRRRVVEGIERFQRRQVARSKALEEKGIELAAMQRRANEGEDVLAELEKAQKAYDWDARIFNERNANLPLACEIPVDIEQRIFALAQTIRFQMSE